MYALLAAAVPPLTATLIAPAEAKDNKGADDRDAIEEMRRQQKEEAQRARQEAREQARRQREEAREQARRDREEAREQARQAREEIQRARQEAQQQAREQAKQFSTEQARKFTPPVDAPDIESSGGFKTETRPQAVREPLRELRSGGNDSSGGGGTDASPGSQQSPGGTGSGYRAQTSGEGGAAKGASGGSTKSTAQPAAGQKGGSKSSQGSEQAGKSKNDDDAGGEAEESSKPPATMAEVFKKLFGAPAKDNPSINKAAPAAKPAAAVPAAPAQPVNGKGKAHDAANGQGANKEKSAQGVSAKPAVANAKSNASAPPAASGGGGGVVAPIDLDIVQRNEVLAINTNKATLQAAVSKGFKLAETSTLSGLNLSVARLITPAGMSKQQAEQQLAGLASNLKAGGFARNERYRIYRTATGVPKASPARPPAASPSGPACSGSQCYARDLMGWQPSLSACAKSVPVGIIDTAVDLTHPAFKKKSIDVGHLSAGKAERSPNWHGTGVLGVLAGDGSSQTPGLIPDARFFVADVFFADDDGEPATDTLSLLRGIDWLKRKGARVVNMSLSGPADDLVRDAIGKLAQSGVIFVAAAGNGGPGAPPSYPAAYEPVIAVTAVNKRMTGYRYANQGSYIDLAAPGVDIWTTLPGAQQGYHSGTSFAAPYVTAALATMYRRLDGTSKSQVLQQVSYRDLGDPGRDPVYGNGMLLAPPSCGAESVANSAPALNAPTSAPPATAPIGFGFQSSSVDAVPAFEQLPWLPAGGQ